jgi:hypothetical protein
MPLGRNGSFSTAANTVEENSMRQLLFATITQLTLVIAGVLGLAAPADAQKTFNQAKAVNGGVTPGDGPGFPVTISTPGSYKLIGNLTVTNPNTHAIHITTNHVTLDLNGFRIAGPGTAGEGSGIVSDLASNIAVINGSVFAFGQAGVRLQGNSHRVEKVFAQGNGSYGIVVNDNSVVSGCVVSYNGHVGITVVSGMAIGNVSRWNGSYGLSMGPATGYAHNVLAANAFGQANGGVQMGAGTNICNAAPCP